MSQLPMMDIVEMPLARRIWGVAKFFGLPISDERIQDINTYDLEFYELSQIADDPKKLERYKNHYFDPEFDEWLEEFELEQEEKYSQKSADLGDLDLPDVETINYSETQRNNCKNDGNNNELDGYEISERIDVDDWEQI